jgi:hypothetical protein
MEGVCIGFSPGSPALSGKLLLSGSRPVEPIDAVDDPVAWHPLFDERRASMRRTRRIDVRLDAQIVIDAYFQDSGLTQTGERIAIHEYLLRATADRETQTLLSLYADPRILPLDTCPGAISNIGRLVGTPLAA